MGVCVCSCHNVIIIHKTLLNVSIRVLLSIVTYCYVLLHVLLRIVTYCYVLLRIVTCIDDRLLLFILFQV